MYVENGFCVIVLLSHCMRWGDHKISHPLYRGDRKILYPFDRGDRKINETNFARFFRPPAPIVNEPSLTVQVFTWMSADCIVLGGDIYCEAGSPKNRRVSLAHHNTVY